MAKEQDQTQDNETQDTNADAAIEKEETASTDAAVKTSEDFDKFVDANPEDVEETPSGDDDQTKDSKVSETKDDTKADDKDTGKDKTEVLEKDDKGTKDTTDTGESNLSKELVKRAFDSGFSDEEIEKFENDAELEKFLDVIESVMSEEDEKIDTTQKTDDKKTEDDKSKIKFDKEDEIDPEILKGIRSLEQQNKDLRDKVDGLVGGIEQQRNAEFIKRFDGYISGLGKEFADTFGTGSTNDLGKRSMAFKNRKSVGKRMRAFGQGMADSGIELPDEQELFDIALTSLHKKKLETVKGLRSSKKSAKYAKGAQLGRSATKKTGKMTGDQKAIATSRAFDEKIDTTEDED